MFVSHLVHACSSYRHLIAFYLLTIVNESLLNLSGQNLFDSLLNSSFAFNII